MIRYRSNKTILNFSDGKVTRSKLRKSLSAAKFIPSVCRGEGLRFSFVDNEILVGMYKIRILLNWEKEGQFLRNYGGFQIRVYQGDEEQEIDLDSDRRFNFQSWIYLNQNSKLKIKHLAEIILYCQRLNKLKAFL